MSSNAGRCFWAGLIAFGIVGRRMRSATIRGRGSATKRRTVVLGGREWESNPLRAVWRPSLALKASRPTGNASPPISIFAVESLRCHLRLGHGSVLLELRRHGTAKIAAAHGDAVAVEELQDQDRHLAAVVEPVAELRGGEIGTEA